MVSPVDAQPIGIFDSGVGGLTILQSLQDRLPRERLVYLADSAGFPYGARTAAEIRARTAASCRALLNFNCKLIVVACNTATVVALAHLRASFPQVPFVGVVPVVKPLAERTRAGIVAVLATPSTARSDYLAGLVERFARDTRVLSIGCPGLADLVEEGVVHGPRVDEALAAPLAQVRRGGADLVGLGCTHYPFLRPALTRHLGDGIGVLDSAEPVARRVATVLAERAALAAPDGRGALRFLATAQPERFRAVASTLLGQALPPVEDVSPIAMAGAAAEID
jgi:glutamate racemase